MEEKLNEILLRKIKILNETIWNKKATDFSITEWLANFKDDQEKIHALYILSKFIYFNGDLIRELLKALYRDLFKTPIIYDIRRKNLDTLDSSLIISEFDEELEKTRFLGMGNPSESGCHLLYYFRQENELPKTLFIHGHEVFIRDREKHNIKLKDTNIKRYVFIDDFCGSGKQAIEYSKEIVTDIKTIDQSIEVDYFTIFALSKGLDNIRENGSFNFVNCVMTLDETFKCFSDNSRFFGEKYNEINKEFARNMCSSYGSKMMSPGHELGFDDCQLLIGFEHNIPDNTLPVIWFNDLCFNESCMDYKKWEPVFKRFNKIYY